MGILEEAAEWLNDQREKCLSVPIVYRRKGKMPVSMTATVGRTLFRAENEYGVTIRTESRDFLIGVDRMPEEPQRGDRIVYAGREFEVLAPNGEPVWRWSGAQHVTRRIHTKEIGGING